MTSEEFLLENQHKLDTTTEKIQGTCDPCEMARLVHRPQGSVGTSSDNLDPYSCIMVDEYGRAQYMVITEDGRWVPVESF